MTFKFAADATTNRNTKVALVELRGTIRDSDTGFSPSDKGISFSKNRRQIDKAFNTNALAAVALLINCPGGSPAQTQLLCDYIRKLADEKKVPVYAFVEDVAASGGYWLAAAADEIFCVSTSTIGSIGVVANVINYHELAEKYGVKNITVTAGKNKVRLNPFEAVKDEDKAWLKEHAERIHQIFREWIQARRGKKLDAKTVDIYTGDVWTGRQALELGLVDGIGNYTDVMEQKLKGRLKLGKKPKYVEIKPPKKGLVSALFGTAASRPNYAEMLTDFLAKTSVRDIHFG